MENLILQRMRYLIASMEDLETPVYFYLISFISIVLLRYVGEGFSQPYNYLNVPSSSDYFWSYIHVTIAYSALGLGFVTIFKIFAKIPVKLAARFIMSGYMIILMAPLLDLLLGPLTGWSTANFYIDPRINVNIPFAYFTAYGGFVGMSLGLRIEILTLIVGLFGYFYLKGYRVLPSLLLTWVNYTWLFFMSCSPYAVFYISKFLGYAYQYNNTNMISYYVLVSLVLCGLLWVVERCSPP